MKNLLIIVKAEWDEESCVWVASSSNIDGLALEASTLELLMQKIPGALCDLLEMNGFDKDSGLADIPYQTLKRSGSEKWLGLSEQFG